MTGEALSDLMGGAATAAYRCRSCGLYICRDHAASQACLGCGERVYDIITKEPTWYVP